MKILKLLSIFGIFLGLSLITTSIYFLTQKKNTPIESNTDTPEQIVTEEKQTEEEQQEEIVVEEEDTELLESGWIPNWAFDTGLTSLRKNISILDEVNPVLYTINKDGSLESRNVAKASIKELQSAAKTNSISVIPTVGSYDYASIANLLKDSSSYKSNISSLIAEIEKYDFDGIDLDFEQIESKYRDIYLEYLKELKSELTSRGKILSVTVFAQWEDAEYTDHKETVLVQDYGEIGEIADRVKIMAYDYTLSTSSKPGPIGPISWIEQILDYAVEKIPKEKIYLGVHLYGYEWVDTKTEALTYTSVKNIIDTPTITSSFKEDIGEGYAKFSCVNGTKTCEMYFQNKEGVGLRREIAKEYGIQGISYWRLGGELDLLQ